MHDTPLGQVVQIRMEKDLKIIQKYSPYERGVRADWLCFKAEKLKNTGTMGDIEQLQASFKKMFGKKEAPHG